jgi:SNF2 family DNA or RNA helicase
MASKIRVERVGDHIHLTGWVGPDTPALCKSVGAGRFSKSDGAHWAYPLSMTICRRIREVFGSQIIIGEKLNAWAREEKARETYMQAIASAPAASLTVVPTEAPAIAAAMANRTYQQVAAAFGAQAGSFGLFDQPGLGKTIETLGAIVETNAPGQQWHLIFSPKVAVKSVWAKEIARWLGKNAAVYPVTGAKENREKILGEVFGTIHEEKHVFVIANIEMARVKEVQFVDADYKTHLTKEYAWPELFSCNWSTIVVDESHRALIRTSGNPTQTRRGFSALRSARRIALSGTPMRGKPQQMWGTLNWLRPDIYTSYWNWVGQYFELISDGYSNYVLAGLKNGGADKMQSDLSTIVLRRTKSEVLKELPPKVYAGSYLIDGDELSPFAVWLEMNIGQQKQYETFVKNGSINFADGSELIANGALVEYTRRKQLANSTVKVSGGKLVFDVKNSVKFEWLVEKLEELGIMDKSTDAKIVVASEFTQLINAYAIELSRLGVSCHVLTGETPEKNRERIIEDFQSDNSSAQVFLLNKKAGGVAVTLDAADDLVLLETSAVPDDDEQVEDRIHRASRIHNVTIHVLQCLKTQDEEIAYIAAARQNVQGYLLDGSRGVEYCKSTYQTWRLATTTQAEKG